MTLLLRPLEAGDEAALRAAHIALASDRFNFGPGYTDGMPFADYVARFEHLRRGVDLAEGDLPTTFLVADVDGAIVGRTSIRHALDEFHAREGGHIGYCVLPEHRRRGYATEILRRSLAIAREVGVERVLITCDDDNLGSAAVIERAGGILESLTPNSNGGAPKRRYWVEP